MLASPLLLRCNLHLGELSLLEEPAINLAGAGGCRCQWAPARAIDRCQASKPLPGMPPLPGSALHATHSAAQPLPVQP
eukprot:3058230-Alexandrium_andersonii.AAC.1